MVLRGEYIVLTQEAVLWSDIDLIVSSKRIYPDKAASHSLFKFHTGQQPLTYAIIYTYKNEIPSVCLLVSTSAPEVWSQVDLFGIGTKPNVLGAF